MSHSASEQYGLFCEQEWVISVLSPSWPLTPVRILNASLPSPPHLPAWPSGLPSSSCSLGYTVHRRGTCTPDGGETKDSPLTPTPWHAPQEFRTEIKLVTLQGVLLLPFFTGAPVQTLFPSLPLIVIARAPRWAWVAPWRGHLALPPACMLPSLPSCHLVLTGKPLSELLHWLLVG